MLVYHYCTSAMSDVDRVTLFNSYYISVFTHASYLLPTLEEMPQSESTFSNHLLRLQKSSIATKPWTAMLYRLHPRFPTTLYYKENNLF